MTTTTRVRVMSANFRISPYPSDEGTVRAWTGGRREACAATFTRLRTAKLMPQVIMAQEWSAAIRDDIMDMLGDRWRFVRNGNVAVLWDTGYLSKVSADIHMLPTPPPPAGTVDPRRLVVARLNVEPTDDDVWFASSHFTVGDLNYQRKQMTSVADFLPNIRNTVFGVDINSSMTSVGSPRAVAKGDRLFPLRDKLALARITNGTANSFNGWQPTVFASEWIDDVFTGDNLQPYYANMILTDIEGSSDHNWPLASIVQIGEET